MCDINIQKDLDWFEHFLLSYIFLCKKSALEQFVTKGMLWHIVFPITKINTEFNWLLAYTRYVTRKQDCGLYFVTIKLGFQ